MRIFDCAGLRGEWGERGEVFNGPTSMLLKGQLNKVKGKRFMQSEEKLEYQNPFLKKSLNLYLIVISKF